MKENKGKALLERVKQAKEKKQDKNFTKIVGKQKSNAKFNKVNFNG